MFAQATQSAASWLHQDGKSIECFLANPSDYFDYSLTDMMSLSRAHLDWLQIAGLQLRFTQFRGSLPMLDKLADAQDIHVIGRLNDALPLLFDHATYKSYPASLLSNHRFTQLTAWLNKLTTIDLSKVDVSSCRTIDDWIMTMSRETSLAIIHTSGTSGTMSFLPWSKREFRKFLEQYPVTLFQRFGHESPALKPPLNIDCIYPYFRSGAYAQGAINDATVDVIAGGEERFHAAFPGRMSADLTLFAAKRRAAAAKGHLAQLEVSPEMAARQKEFEAEQRDMPDRIAAFFDAMRTKLSGKRVFMIANTHLLFSLAENGLKLGLRNLFSSDSVINSGGGSKGMTLPDDWEQTVKEFFGVERVNTVFGMSEMGGLFIKCSQGHHHSVPWIIPFILDPETNKPLPRSGTVTGRFAFYDLLQETRWGGFITGDEVTMAWDSPCPCQQTTPYFKGKIQRVSETRTLDGEEKLNCAAAPEAYAEALDFLNEGIA